MSNRKKTTVTTKSLKVLCKRKENAIMLLQVGKQREREQSKLPKMTQEELEKHICLELHFKGHLISNQL